MREYLRVGDVIIALHVDYHRIGNYTEGKQYKIESLEKDIFSVKNDIGAQNFFTYGSLDEGSSYHWFKCVRVERLLKTKSLTA